MKEVQSFVVLGLVLFFSITFASAGIFDAITGKASIQPTNVTLFITGATQLEVFFVSPLPSVNPTELNYTDVTFDVYVKDSDGVDDINDSSVMAQFQRSGEPLREDVLCIHQNDIDLTSANYSCTIRMWYFDDAGGWFINASATDLGNGTRVYNDTTNMTYNQLKAMVITPEVLTWDALGSGSTDQKSNNDPTVVNNTGNYDGDVKVNAIDLLGQTVSSDFIPANNFTSHTADPTVCISGTVLSNATSVSIAGSDANRGNLSIGGGAGQEELFYCIPLVPLVSSQTYSTDIGGPWTIIY